MTARSNLKGMTDRNWSADDRAHMRAALGLARRGLGNVWPNPAVGCVLVRDGHVVGRGWTQPGGRPHAEVEALRRAGDKARGATAYVTLEPCSHTGKTGPCAQALIEAGVTRVVSALVDPDPRVGGRGLAMLRDAGIQVDDGLNEAEAAGINQGFLFRVTRGRPMVTLKTATTLDGRIATSTGESQWITGPKARKQGHLIRAAHDAVMVGSGTVLADDPSLTCRLPGHGHKQPVRVVMDGRLRLSPDSQFARAAKDIPTWVLTRQEADKDQCQQLEGCGVEILECASGADGRLDPAEALTLLGARGLTRLMVEGGGELSAGLFRAGLVDRIAWFRAAGVMGGDGLSAIAGYGVDRLDDMRRFNLVSRQDCGPDILEIYERRDG